LLRAEAERAKREVESDIRALEARDRALGQTITRLNERSRQLSQTTRQYTDLQRELEIASNNLNQFLTKREALGIDVAQSESPWEVLTPPNNPVAVSASVPKNVALGSLLGLLLGTSLAITIDRLRDLVHSTKDIQVLTGLPLLGTIPFDRGLATKSHSTLSLPEGNFLSSAEDSESSLAKMPETVEFFRSTYTNIRLLNPDLPVGSVVVSSAIPGEGKSTVSTHLAKAAAAMGRRVLLVDADLRRSKPEHSQEALGLTHLIDQADLEINQVIQQSPLEDNLFFLPSGHIPPDPSKVLASEKMQALMTKLENQFELVIYDGTILTGFTDAHLLASSTNGLVLVTGMGKLKRSLLEETIQQLKISRTPVLGIVVNGDKNLSLNLY
ncbi:MAG: polysaccharide biosynthesis tyrosine autokinase, partial [Halothece sp. Uz-M2-17]|nr:polysaccharide biosynthesis tyrosine autokinase [Halothece sp. Uz-M2-17]